MPDFLTFEEVLRRAISAQYGIAVLTPTPERLRQKLYAIMRTEPFALSLQTSRTNPEGELWIVRKEFDDV